MYDAPSEYDATPARRHGSSPRRDSASDVSPAHSSVNHTGPSVQDSSIEFGLLGPLVKVGREAAKEAPELLGTFRLNRSNATHKSFLIAARAMLAEANGARELLVSQGLAATLLDDLAKALDRFEAESNGINLNRRAHIGARGELTEVAGDLTDLVDVLDGFNRYRYQLDPEQLAVWNAARNVVAHTVRRRAPADTETGPTPPTTPDGSTKAA